MGAIRLAVEVMSGKDVNDKEEGRLYRHRDRPDVAKFSSLS